MCSRYSIDEKTAQWMRGYCNEHLEHYVQTIHDVQDVHPNDIAPVLIGSPGLPAIVPIAWGFERKCTGGLTINARMETLWQRPMFSYSIQSRRCILPASQFYEWDAVLWSSIFVTVQPTFLRMTSSFIRSSIIII